jgi:hypothetical protein
MRVFENRELRKWHEYGKHYLTSSPSLIALAKHD